MKLREFQQLLSKCKINFAFFNYDDPSVRYFVGQEFTGGFLVVTPRRAFCFISALDGKPKNKAVNFIFCTKNWSKRCGLKLVKNIGINKTHLTVELLEKIKKKFPTAKIKDVSEKLEELRLEKTVEEIASLKKACTLTSAAFGSLIKEFSRQGFHRKQEIRKQSYFCTKMKQEDLFFVLKTEEDVALFLEAFIRKKGGTIAFPTIAAMGKNAAIPHHITSSARLTRGVLLVDFGARIDGYCADMSRVIFLGKPTTEERKKYRLLLKSQQTALNSVKEKMLLSQLEKIARHKLGRYASSFNHSLGHGIGLEIHEKPLFSDPNAVVMKNVPFTIEPGLYFKNQFGLRIEDTVVWNGRELEILTTATKKMNVVTQFRM